MDAADPKPPPVPVAYAPAEGIGRRAFRTLIVLTFANTVLLGLIFVGPTLTPFVRQQWADYQAARANRAAEAQAAAVRQSYLPAQQLCLDYLDPPGTLRYAEDADGIATLEATGTAKHVGKSEQSSYAMQALPIGAADPTCATQMPSALTTYPTIGGSAALPQPAATLLFLHERRTAAGSRLVVVSISSLQQFESQKSGVSDFLNYWMTTHRDLLGTVIRPAAATVDGATVFGDALSLRAGRTLVTVMIKPGQSPAVLAADYAGQLRLYAGQPDAADPARFHIPYQMDGHRGTVDGQLTADDHLRLVPDKWLADQEQQAAEHPPQVPSPDDRRATGKPR